MAEEQKQTITVTEIDARIEKLRAQRDQALNELVLGAGVEANLRAYIHSLETRGTALEERIMELEGQLARRRKKAAAQPRAEA